MPFLRAAAEVQTMESSRPMTKLYKYQALVVRVTVMNVA